MSKLFKLDWSDAGKGFIMAVLGAVFGIIQGSIDAGSFTFDFKKIWQAALTAAVAYIIKNLLTSSSGTFLGSNKQ